MPRTFWEGDSETRDTIALKRVTKVMKVNTYADSGRDGKNSCASFDDVPPPHQDLFGSICRLLIVGKLLFLLPCEGFTWKSHREFDVKKNSVCTVICISMIIWCLVKDLVGLKFLLQVSHGGVVGYAHPAHYFLVSAVITVIYLYFFVRFPKLKSLFSLWDKLAPTYQLQVFSLTRATRLALLPMTLPFLINTLFAIDAIHRIDGRERVIPENLTEWEFVYQRLIQHWHSTLPYSKQFTLLCLLDFIWGSLPRAFVLSTVIVFSYVVSRQFKDLCRKGRERLVRYEQSDAQVQEDEEETKFWTHLALKHDALTDLTLEVDSFLSPLIFVTYMTSLYLLCMQLLRALSSATNEGAGDEGLTLGLSPVIYQMSFCFETFYLYYMSIAAAQVNHYAHAIGDVLRKIQLNHDIREVSRLESRVNFGPSIGFTGLGCFVITKPFLLTIANAVITLEIVLLQAQVSQPFRVST